MFLRIVAALLGLNSLDELIQRDRQAQRARFRALLTISSSVILVLTTLLGLAILFAITLERMRNDALIAQSEALAQDSQTATVVGDARLGVLLALAALPRSIEAPDRSLTIDAIGALSQAYPGIANDRVLLVPRLTAAAFSRDGKRIVSLTSERRIDIRDSRPDSDHVAAYPA